ncbi:MAG: response regulator [Planctomycetes bacterium]|nr:response regulator [Planctomycetota bacterium]
MKTTKPSILIVEDDQHYIELYKRILEGKYDVTVAHTIHIAEELITDKSFAIVMVDLKIPGIKGKEMGGLDFIPKLRKTNPCTEIVVITAYGTLDIALKVGHDGVSAFIQKPINVDEVREIISRGVASYGQNIRLLSNVPIEDPLQNIERILESFTTCVGRLVDRGYGRPAIEMANEYDVQDLLYVMIKPLFPGLECEEYTPKYAGSQKRVDFVIKEIGVIIEAKYVRDKRHAKTILDEIKIDIESYHAHAHCNTLIFFIYDPNLEIQDARKKMLELSGTRSIKGREMQVKIIVSPR